VLAFILRRIMQSVAVMAVVALIAFSLFNFVGDPVVSMVGQDATMEEKDRLRSELDSTSRWWCSLPLHRNASRVTSEGRSPGTQRGRADRERLPRRWSCRLARRCSRWWSAFRRRLSRCRDSWGASSATASLVGVSLPSFSSASR
jgi:peptide/nickel transport system permease protein